MTVWRAEVDITSVSTAQPAAGLFPDNLNNPGAYYGASYALVAVDVDTLYVLTVNIIHDRRIHLPGVNAYLTRISPSVYGLVPTVPLDPYNNVLFTGNFTNLDIADGGAGFAAGGVIAIEKNTVTGALDFITPAGTISTTCGAQGANQTAELRPGSIGLLLNACDIPPASNAVQSIEVKFADFYGKQDGVTISGAALSASDPGMWADWIESAIFSALVEPTFTQEATDEDALLVFPIDPNPFFSGVADGWYRVFQGADHMPAPLPIDLVVYRPTNTLFGAWQRMPTDLMARRSQDDGHSWVDSEIEAGTPAESVTLQVFAGEVWTCYYDGSQIVTQKSQDFGASWSSAMPVPIVGTNPRLVISPEGAQFYFYCAGGALRLQRSYDFGATLFDAAPITVASPVTAQDFGAVLAADRSLIVSYIDTGNWITRKSQDWGSTWITV